MPIVQVQKGLPPCQVDDFGKDVERSAKGALYFRPASTKTITDGELEHLKKNHPEIAKRLVVVPEKKAAAPKPAKPAEPKVEEPKVEEPVKPAEPAEDPKPKSTFSSGRNKRRSEG